MRVLAVEYITGGGLAGHELPPSLAREGGMMAEALLRELAGIAGVGVFSARDPRLPAPYLGACFLVPMAARTSGSCGSARLRTPTRCGPWHPNRAACWNGSRNWRFATANG